MNPWSRSQVIVTPIVSVLLALAVGGLLSYIQGVNPLTAYWVLFSSALGDVDGLVTVMEKSTPLILTGLAFTVGLRTGLFNIGAQGQLLVGAIGAAWAGYNFQMPAIIHLPFAIAFGILCGAAWASIAGVLRAYRSVSEVITTIMLNAVAIALVDYLASKPLQEPDQPLTRTPPVTDTAALPEFGVIPSGFVIALFVSLFFGWFLARTTRRPLQHGRSQPERRELRRHRCEEDDLRDGGQRRWPVRVARWRSRHHRSIPPPLTRGSASTESPSLCWRALTDRDDPSGSGRGNHARRGGIIAISNGY